MNNFRYVVACAFFAAAVSAWADGIPSARAEAYYRTHFEESSEGAYEWPEEGLLFFKAVMASNARAESEELSRTQRLMRTWLAGKAAARREDPRYPYGLDMMRRTCRQFLPDLEYSATWNFSGDTCAFTYERGRKREVVTVVRRDVLLEALPKAFLEPVDESVWRTGIRMLATQRYSRQADPNFLWSVGALDCFVSTAPSRAQFPSWDAGDFGDALRRFLDDACADVAAFSPEASPALEEFKTLSGEIAAYLIDGERAKGFVTAARSVVAPPPRISYEQKDAGVHCTTNAVVSFTTNTIENASTRLRHERFAQSDGTMVLPVAVCSNMVDAVVEECDDCVEMEVEMITIVRTAKRIVRKVAMSYSGEPRFEMLFLAAGFLDNSSSPQTEKGKAAVTAFSAKIPAAERESRIVDALRENPGDKELWNMYGRILQDKGEHCGAIVCFRNALRLDRRYDFALTNLAISCDALGKKHLACATAMIARALTENKWCLGKLDAIISKER